MPASQSLSLDLWHSAPQEVVERRIVVRRVPRRILVIARGHHHNHALPSAGQQNAIGIFQIAPPFEGVNTLPSVATKRPVVPPLVGETEIRVPHDTNPVQL